MNSPTSAGYRRRRVIRRLGVGGITALAGCLSWPQDGALDDGEGDVREWQGTTIEDISGAEFRIAEISSPTILHTFATNCLTCATQQQELSALWEARADVEIVELTVDPNDTAADLARHAERGSGEWRVGVAPDGFVRSLVEEFGQAVAVSAQSPIIVVCEDGETDTRQKVASADILATAIDDTC